MKHPEKLTRKEVAEALGVTPKTLATWEKQGKIPPPDRDWRGWRLYDRAVVRDMRRKLLGGEMEQPDLGLGALDTSARTRLKGVVKEIVGEGVMAEVVLSLPDGQEIVSVLPRSAVRRLGLRVGDRAYALVNASDVLLAR